MMATQRVSTGPEADRLHSVKRSLAVLEALASRPVGATPKELSQALGLHLSTCYRILNTLVAAGYAVRAPDNGLFRLGRRVSYLQHGYQIGLQPPPEVLAFLHALQVATGETAMLIALEGDDAIATAVVAGSRPSSQPAGYVGQAAPAHGFAAGRVLLAWLPADQIEAYLTRLSSAPQSPWFLPATPDTLRADLERIRKAGYALDRGEGNPDVCCVAAPITGTEGVEAAISVVAPCIRLRQEEAATLAVVLEIARAMSALQTTLPPRDDRSSPGIEELPDAAQEAIKEALATIAEAMSRVS